jgi:hypothetical protein
MNVTSQVLTAAIMTMTVFFVVALRRLEKFYGRSDDGDSQHL